MDRDDQKRQLIIDYHATFDTEHGKRVFENMKKCARFNFAVVFKDSTGRIDPLEMARHEGMRSVIIDIEKHLEKKPQ